MSSLTFYPRGSVATRPVLPLWEPARTAVRSDVAYNLQHAYNLCHPGFVENYCYNVYTILGWLESNHDRVQVPDMNRFAELYARTHTSSWHGTRKGEL